MSDHTPGPWHTDAGPIPGMWHVWRTDEPVWIADVWTTESDARLMAAAPDFSDAVRQHLWALEHNHLGELLNSRRSMRSAIAKAEGRES